MSWSTSTKRTAKIDAEQAIDEIEIPQYVVPYALDQIRAAQRAAKELLKSVPGPDVVISMSGHANGVGWCRKEGYANDTVTITVTQYTESDPVYPN